MLTLTMPANTVEQLLSLLSNLDVADESCIVRNGFCYAHLAKDEVKNRIRSFLGPNPKVLLVKTYFAKLPGDFSPGFFTAVFGTKYGVDNNLTRHISIRPSEPQNSRLTASLLLSGLPDEWTVGGFEENSASNLPSASAPSSAFPISLLGTVNTTSETQINFIATGASTGKSAAAGSIRNFAFSNASTVRSFTDRFQLVRAVNVSVTLVPVLQSADYFLSIAWCWYPESDDAPTSREKILSKPLSGYLTLAPPVPGGYWAAVEIPCPLDKHSVSSLIKPDAPIGRAPALCLVTYSTPLPGKTHHPEIDICELFVRSTLKIGM